MYMYLTRYAKIIRKTDVHEIKVIFYDLVL